MNSSLTKSPGQPRSPTAMSMSLSHKSAAVRSRLTELRCAVDQMRSVVELMEGRSSNSTDREAASPIVPLDVSDTKYCLETLKAAAAAIDRAIDTQPGSPGPSSRKQSTATSGPIDRRTEDSDDDLASDDSSEAREMTPGALQLVVPPRNTGPATAAPLGGSNTAQKPPGLMPNTAQSSPGSRLGSFVPKLDIMGATPREGDLTSADGGGHNSGRTANQSKWHNPFRDAKVVDEEQVEDEDVAKWLNDNFADQYKRESTGFEVKLQRSNSIMSSVMTPRGAERDEEEASLLFQKSQLLLPDGSACVPTKYARTHQRTYPAFATRRKFEAALAQAAVDPIPNINDSDFNIFPWHDKLGDGVFTAISANVFLQYNFVNSLGINLTYFMNFLRELELHYTSNNPYHNGCHAADVLQTTNVYLCTGDVKENFSDVELIAILFAAMIHDVGHPGISNAFLNKAHHPLSKLYNDNSTLESMHAAMAFILLDKPECNFFETSRSWTKLHDADFRSLVIEIVIGTDMKHHASMMQSVSDILEDGQIEDNEVVRLFRAIVHAADLSNPMKPLKVYLNWMERVLAEYWQQGDEERRRGMDISMLCDRNNPSVFKSQVGFIEFVVKPLMQELAPVLPPVWIERLMSNLEYVRNAGADAEAASLRRIATLSAKPWVDMPIRSHSFFTVVMKYFDAYRLTSQLVGDDGSVGSGPESPWNRSIYPGLATQRSTIEAHQTRFAEEAERWLHQILAYRPAANAPPSILVAAGVTGGSPAPAGNNVATADEAFFERFCTAWLINVLEFQMQQRLQNHAQHDERHGANTFVPYLDEEAATIIASSPEAQVFVRRREQEDKKMEANMSGNTSMHLTMEDAEDAKSETYTPRGSMSASQAGVPPTLDEERTWSWLKKDDGKKENSSMSKGSQRRTLLQAYKAAEYVADEDVLISAINANAKLAVRAVDFVVHGRQYSPKIGGGTVPAAGALAGHGPAVAEEQPAQAHRGVVRVIDPAPASAKQLNGGPRSVMIRFINALTKMLVVSFHNHVRRSTREGRRRSSATATGPGDNTSVGATVDATSVLNDVSVRERTTKWIEELYNSSGRGSPSGNRSRSSPGASALAAALEQPQVPIVTVIDLGIRDAAGGGGGGSRRPSNRSDYPSSIACTEPHGFRTPMDAAVSPTVVPRSIGMTERLLQPNSPAKVPRVLSTPTGALVETEPEIPAHFTLGVDKSSSMGPKALSAPASKLGVTYSPGTIPSASVQLLRAKSSMLATLADSDALSAGPKVRSATSTGGVILPPPATQQHAPSLIGAVDTKRSGLERASVVKYVANARRLDASRLNHNWEQRLQEMRVLQPAPSNTASRLTTPSTGTREPLLPTVETAPRASPAPVVRRDVDPSLPVFTSFDSSLGSSGGRPQQKR